MKLSKKIYLFSSVLFIVLHCVASIVIYFVFSHISLQNELQQLRAEAVHVTSELKQASEQAVVEELLRSFVPVNGLIALIDDPNQLPIIVTSASEAKLNEYTFAFSPSLIIEKVSFKDSQYGYVSVPYIASNGQIMNVQLMMNLAELTSMLRLLRLVLVVVAICVCIPAIFSSRLLGELIMKPIKAMTRTMKEVVRSGSFVKLQSVEQSKDELYEMGETFNEMIELLESNYKRQEQFVSNASHELKTPITVIESYASLIKRRVKQQPEILEESIEAIHSEAIRMKEMTEQLLLLAKPSRQWNIVKKDVDLLELTEKTAQHYRKAYQREITIISSTAQEAVVVQTDPEKLTQLLIILLDNARKYSESTIQIELKQDETEVYSLTVKDYGIGIPKDELERIFERFYRVDQTRTRQTTEDKVSVGLGLSLAKEIAEAIQVDIQLDSVEGLGTTATIIFNHAVSSQ